MGREIQPHSQESLSQRREDFNFAMQWNGYFQAGGQWRYNADTARLFKQEFAGQRVSFFGPGGVFPTEHPFFSGEDVGYERLIPVFLQDSVLHSIRKYRERDEWQAARIAFILGGIVRHTIAGGNDLEEMDRQIIERVDFVARMAQLGGYWSGDAVTSAMAMYVISGGPLEHNDYFVRDVYHMTEAITEDPIEPKTTKELGLSQVARLRSFIHKVESAGLHDLDGTISTDTPPLPDIKSLISAFEGFPTVGAEFHFSWDATEKHPEFWERLALLNMSQYQKGSYVQLSRYDRGVIEVRMNPSIYPVTIANWRNIRRLLPELDKVGFTITVNRDSPDSDFTWQNKNDETILQDLKSLSVLIYASIFDGVAQPEYRDEINFGHEYLGQTVKLHNGKYSFTGLWSGEKGHDGQLGVYVGQGKNLPDLAYYLSMALVKPHIIRFPTLSFKKKVRSLRDATSISQEERLDLFRAIDNQIATDERLREADEAGAEIMNLLSP